MTRSSSESSRPCYGVISGITILFVATINTALWLIAYNNFRSGELVLISLISLNVTFLLLPGKYWPNFISLQYVRAAAVSFVSLWLVLSLLEFIFPLIASREYAQMVDLSNRFLKGRTTNRPQADLVFFNNTEHTFHEKNENGPISWHVPGKLYIYTGYEPNLKKTYDNLVTWNSLGYFDKEYPRAKSDKTYRIVVIGDSYVESVQVPLLETFHKKLEQSLNSNFKVDGFHNFEVIALGASGAGQSRNFATLSGQAAELDPDMVIVTFCSNDICDDDQVLKKELDLVSNTISPTIRNLMHHGFWALAFAFKRINDINRNSVAVSPELLQWSQNPPGKLWRGWKNSLDSIRESKNFCDSKGIAFLLVYLGSDIETKFALSPQETVSSLKSLGSGYAELEWDFQQSLRVLLEFSENNRINFLSLQESLVNAQRKTGLFVFGDHYSIYGHKIASIVLDCAVRKLILKKAGIDHLSVKDDCKDIWEKAD